MTTSLSRISTGAVSPQNLAYLDENMQRHISSGRPAGALTVVYHKGQVAHWSAQGLRDRERGKPITDDTIFRIYSMTKPITSVALMQLYERGLVLLDDPVHRYIPSTRFRRTSSATSWRSSPVSGSTAICRSGSSSRSRCATPASGCARTRPIGWRPTT